MNPRPPKWSFAVSVHSQSPTLGMRKSSGNLESHPLTKSSSTPPVFSSRPFVHRDLPHPVPPLDIVLRESTLRRVAGTARLRRIPMKTIPMKKQNPCKLGFTLAGVLALTLNSGSAAIVFDLQASAVDGSLGTLGNEKTVIVSGTTGNVTFEVWAQVTNAAPSNNIFGVQQILGSIKSTTIAGTPTGTMAPAVPRPPFFFVFSGGAVAELSSPTDAVTDLGSNSTISNTSFVNFVKDPASSGEVVGSRFFATNNSPVGATFNAITNGYEFLMGTATLNITSFSGSSSLSMNWAIPDFLLVSSKIARAQWTDGDGIANNGLAQFAEMSAGSPVILTSVPEPSTLALVGFGLVGLALRRKRQ